MVFKNILLAKDVVQAPGYGSIIDRSFIIFVFFRSCSFWAMANELETRLPKEYYPVKAILDDNGVIFKFFWHSWYKNCSKITYWICFQNEYLVQWHNDWLPVWKMNCGKLVRDFESCCSKRGTGADVSYDSEQVAAVYRGNYEVERILDRREHKCVVTFYNFICILI